MNYVRAARNWWPVTSSAAKWGSLSIPFSRVMGNTAWSRYCMLRWCVDTCNKLGIKRSLHNGHLLHRQPQCVYVANHQSLLDIVVIGSFLHSDYRWVSKDAIFKVPFLGPHLKYTGHIPVYRGERASEANSQLPHRIKKVVDQGADIFFFAEGTRSQDSRLQPFRIGAFMTAALNDLPIVPLVVRGTGQLLVKGARDLSIDARKECTVTVLEPLRTDTEGDARTRAEALRDLTWRTMAVELGQLDALDQHVTDSDMASEIARASGT